MSPEIQHLIIAAVAFVVAGMALGLLVYRDSRPRRDDWQSIVRRVDSPPPSERHHDRRYCQRHDADEEVHDGN